MLKYAQAYENMNSFIMVSEQKHTSTFSPRLSLHSMVMGLMPKMSIDLKHVQRQLVDV